MHKADIPAGRLKMSTARSRTVKRGTNMPTSSCRMWGTSSASYSGKRPEGTILVLSGGEPLFRPDIFDIAKHAKKQGLTLALATNGTLVDEAMAKKIVDAGIQRVSISLDGAEAKTHDEFRKLPGSFDAAVRGIKNLRALGMEVQINSTIAKHNAHQVKELYKMAQDLDAG